MESPTRAPGYDLFKLIVAIVLLILALILMWASPPQASVSLLMTSTAVPASSTSPATDTPLPPPLPTATEAFEPTATPPPNATATPTSGATPTPTPPPNPTVTPTLGATPTPEGTSPMTACEAATSRSRLQVGKNAAILRRLNFRSSPGIRHNRLLTNIPGTQVKIVGGPECVPYWTGAYLWWQIQLPDGRVGWSAEGSLQGSFYFMEPNE